MIMSPSRHAFGFLARAFAAFLFFAAMTPSLMAQKKSGDGGSAPAPAPHPSGGGGGGGAPHPSGGGGTPHPSNTGTTGTHTNTGTNATGAKTGTGTSTGTGKTGYGTAAKTGTGTGTSTGKTGYGASAKTGTGTTGAKTGTGTGAGAGKTGTTSLKSAAVANGAAKAGGGAGAKGASTPGTTKMSNGGTRTVHTNGSVVEKGSNGKVSSVTTAKGTTAKMGTNGKTATISNNKGTTVYRAPNGSRTVVSHGANGNKVVSTGKGRGYAQHTYSRNGHSYARRTYYSHGHYYARAYRGYYWHGHPYYGYVPGYYYGPAYYGWAYNPWASPVYYGWGWGAAPWYGYYGYYYAPYPYYTAPYFWLTDYMVAATLAAAYENAQSGSLISQADFVNANFVVPDDTKGKDVVLTPEIKKMLADQVKAQIAKDKAEAAAAQGGSGGGAQAGGGGEDQTPPSLDPDFTIFIVNADLTVDVNGQSCSLTAGDFIHREVDAPGSDDAVAVKVVASKKEDCAVGSDTRVQLEDLTDMYNHFREQLDAGMKDLSEKQGKNGIPASPAPGGKANPEGQVAPDLTTQSELQKADGEADDAEKDVNSAAAEDNKS
jgi:hypothetical protein